ncbi:MAG TPA: phosphate-starvation-inducible PsiE family protein [Acetobacteraceae bacterium]|nr:phosphate-starvation-inducible PsiE family protein [Acetobacteraceae bacterium]
MDTSLPPAEPPRRIMRVPDGVFEKVEHIVYILLAALLSLAGLLALGSAGLALLGALRDWGSVEPILSVVERLLFALMLIEILHTVRASMRSGTLTPEPFLVVGLIASIRRMLVITLESSQQTQPANWSPQSESLFRAAMTELAVLGGLILVLVVSIFLLRRRHVA